MDTVICSSAKKCLNKDEAACVHCACKHARLHAEGARLHARWCAHKRAP